MTVDWRPIKGQRHTQLIGTETASCFAVMVGRQLRQEVFRTTNDDLSERHAGLFILTAMSCFTILSPFSVLSPKLSPYCSEGESTVELSRRSLPDLPLLQCGSSKHSTHAQGMPPQGRHGCVHLTVHPKTEGIRSSLGTEIAPCYQ